MQKNYIFWMKYALKLAKKASNIQEIPVGAVIVKNDKIIGKGWNKNINQYDPTAHAEIIALRNAAKKIKNHRILNATIYVTLEPCLMCFSALIHSRIKHLVFGTEDNKINQYRKFVRLYFLENKIKITKGILSKKCSFIIKNFLKKKRLKK